MALDPLPKNKWSPPLAAHLLNRAGFGGSPLDVAVLHRQGQEAAVEMLLDTAPEDGVPDPAWANAFSARHRDGMDGMRMRDSNSLEQERIRRVHRRIEEARMFDLRAWWLYRMRQARHPLQEKMTLFLHGHFATGYQKVRRAYSMYLQNQMFRRHALGNWKTLVEEVSRDPAMLVYLDGVDNARGSPNENYAREVMELFTLGEGHYTEEDIREAARAFTGWTYRPMLEHMEFVEKRHDNGSKLFMGQRGTFGAEEVVGIILNQPQAARWLATQLWTFFAYDQPEPEVVEEMARVLRAQDFELKPALKTMFMSRAFYGGRAWRRQVKSPVQWLVGTSAFLEMPMPHPAMSVPLLQRLGQHLFEPPNVKGWDGGVTWITTSSLAFRYEAANRLAGDVHGRFGYRGMEARRNELLAEAEEAGISVIPPPDDTPWMQAPDDGIDWARLLPETERVSRKSAMNSLSWRFYQADLRARDRGTLEQFFAGMPEPSAWRAKEFRKALAALLCTPYYQLT